MRTFHFSGFGGGLGATLTDLLGTPASSITGTTFINVAAPPPSSTIIPSGSLRTLLVPAPPPSSVVVGGTAPAPTTLTLAVDPKWLAAKVAAEKVAAEKVAAEKVAAAAVELERARVSLADANDAFKRARAGDKGTRGSGLIPVELVNELEDRRKLAEEKVEHAQAVLEAMSPMARFTAALKWALLPTAAGMIVVGMVSGKGKVIGMGLMTVGVGLGVFRYFKIRDATDDPDDMDADESQ